MPKPNCARFRIIHFEAEESVRLHAFEVTVLGLKGGWAVPAAACGFESAACGD